MKFGTDKNFFSEQLSRKLQMWIISQDYNMMFLFHKELSCRESYEKFCIGLVSYNGNMLKYISDQTEEMCRIAVQNQPFAIRFAKIQTPEICLEAVKNCGLLLKYVENQTEEMCIAAIQSEEYSIFHIKEQTEKICLMLVKQAVHINIMEHIIDQTEEICLEAVRHYENALKYIRIQTEKICLEAVKYHPFALKLVIDQTEEICLEALSKGTMRIVEYIRIESDRVNRYIIENLPHLKYLEGIT